MYAPPPTALWNLKPCSNVSSRKRAAEESQIPEAKQRNAQVKKLLNAQHKKFEQVKNAADAAKKEGQALRTRWVGYDAYTHDF